MYGYICRVCRSDEGGERERKTGERGEEEGRKEGRRGEGRRGGEKR